MEKKETTIIAKAEALLREAWKMLKEKNIHLANVADPEFKVVQNTKNQLTKGGALNSPSLFKVISAVKSKMSLGELANSFVAQINLCKSGKEEYAEIKSVTQIKGYINIDLIEEAKQILEEAKDKTDPYSSLQTTVVRDEKNDPTFLLKPIGYMDSCFREKFGTPRQGNLIKLSRGKIVLRKEINGDALEGLEEFSHAWLYFIFDLYIGQYSRLKTMNDCPKVKEKKGVFATRSPCRFNPIGMSAVRIDKVDTKNGILYVSGLDLVQGTPIIDIKPYTKPDIIPEATIPGWVKDPEKKEEIKVEIIPQASKGISELIAAKKLEFYNSEEEVMKLIGDVLTQNPHSKSAICGKKCGIFALCLDNMEVVYQINDLFNHFQVLEVNECKKSEKERIATFRTESWLVKTKLRLQERKLI